MRRKLYIRDIGKTIGQNPSPPPSIGRFGASHLNPGPTQRPFRALGNGLFENMNGFVECTSGKDLPEGRVRPSDLPYGSAMALKIELKTFSYSPPCSEN